MASKTNGSAQRQIVINKIAFEAPAPYSEGHTLTANEAAVLNQTFGENLRNNFSSRVTKAQEEAAKNNTEIDLVALQAEFTDYAKDYTFGSSRGGGVRLDPVTREAREIARSKVGDALKAKGRVLKEVTTEQMNAYIDQALEKYPAITEAAKKAVAAREKAAKETLELTI